MGRRKGRHSRGLVHPRTSIGGGARWLAVHEVDEPDSGRGRSGAKRNGVPRECLPFRCQWGPVVSQVPKKWPTCDARMHRKPITVTGDRKNEDLRRICHPPATLRNSTCDVTAFHLRQNTEDTAVNVPKSGTSTAKRAVFAVNLTKSGTFTAVRGKVSDRQSS